MAEDEDYEEHEEEAEDEIFEPIPTDTMPDGPKTYILGGESTVQSVDEALKMMTGGKDRTLFVREGTYDESLDLTNPALNEIAVLADCPAGRVTFTKGAKVGITRGTVRGIAFSSTSGDPALRVECLPKLPACRVEFIDCTFTGGKNVVEVYPYAMPTLAACTIEDGSATGLYGFPRSKATLKDGFAIRGPAPAPLLKTKPPLEGDPPPPICEIPASAMVVVRGEEPVGDDGVRWCRVSCAGVEGLVQRSHLDYTNPKPCRIRGRGTERTTGVLLDDSECRLLDTIIQNHETGVYMSGPCIGAIVEGCVISEICGVGMYFNDGCRGAARRNRIRKCQHYAILVAAGTAPDNDPISRKCQEREEALMIGATHTAERLQQELQQQGVKLDDAGRTWRDKEDRVGKWGPGETRPIIRDNIIAGHVKIGSRAFPGLHENVVVKSDVIAEDSVFAVTGIRFALDEPAVKLLVRDDEDEGGE